jgi:DNA polymerase-3 subunit delta'
MTPAPLPWHGPTWHRLQTMMASDRVHHALLLSGAAGLGKLRFALRAAQALLCEADVEASQRPCGECRSCRLQDAGSHPDFMLLQPEEDKRSIGVEQVRERIGNLSLTAHYAGRRVAVVQPADALNRHAADALLKTLEEPGSAVVFLLVTAREATLPVTLRSRCLSLRFQAATREQAMTWFRQDGAEAPDEETLDAMLRWCAGAPLAARAALDADTPAAVARMGADLEQLMRGELGVVAVAERWRKLGLATTLEWQLKIVTALMRRAAGAPDGRAALATHPIDRGLDLKRLNVLCDELLELRSAAQRQLNPNEQLGLEHLAASWVVAAGQGG